MKNISSKARVSIATLIAVLAPAAIVYAALNTLNGQSGASQTFSNDANVTISSASNVHSLGWSGALATSRGGTGTSTWITGSIPFFDGTRLTEDSRFSLSTGGGVTTISVDAITTNNGDVEIVNGILDLSDGTGAGFTTSVSSSGRGKLSIGGPGQAILDASYISFESNPSNYPLFVFPNQGGTFALLHGLATSTISIGDIKSCIVMADSDGSGVTYVTANDGVLTATTTQPSNCQ